MKQLQKHSSAAKEKTQGNYSLKLSISLCSRGSDFCRPPTPWQQGCHEVRGNCRVIMQFGLQLESYQCSRNTEELDESPFCRHK